MPHFGERCGIFLDSWKGEQHLTKENWKPWDCADTFGKRKKHFDPNQANLQQWPLKISMVPPLSPYFHKAHLVVAADCSAFSYVSFHRNLLRGRVLVTLCPRLEQDFAQRLSEILKLNDIQSLTIIRMDAPCCKPVSDEILYILKQAGKQIPVQFTTIFAEGEVVD